MSIRDIIGTFFILLCIFLISYGSILKAEEKGDTSSEVKNIVKDDENFNLIMAIAMAILTGMILTLNTVTIQWAINLGVNID